MKQNNNGLAAKKIGYETDKESANRNTFYQLNHFYGFKKITEERKEEILNKAFFWKQENSSLVGRVLLDKLYLMLIKSHRLLGIERGDESYLFFIMAFDPELKLLQIYYEESLKENIKKRFEEEFQTFYSSRILDIEKYYNKRFPTIIDEFTKKI